MNYCGNKIDTEYLVAFDWRIKDVIGVTCDDLVRFLKHTTHPTLKTMSLKEFRDVLDYVDIDVITNNKGHIIAMGAITSNCEHLGKDKPKTYNLWYAVTEEVETCLKTLTIACYNKLLAKINNIDKVFSIIIDSASRLYFEKMLNMKEAFCVVGIHVGGTGKDILKKIKNTIKIKEGI